MKKTATAKQVKDNFIVSDMVEAMQKIREAQDKEWDMDRGSHLFLDILKQLSEQAAADGVSLEDWTPLDKMAWAVKEAYIIGFLKSFEIVMESNKMGYAALFGE